MNICNLVSLVDLTSTTGCLTSAVSKDLSHESSVAISPEEALRHGDPNRLTGKDLVIENSALKNENKNLIKTVMELQSQLAGVSAQGALI
jgi:hypothetical protein